MAGWELRDMSGSLFRNANKDEERHADYKGEIMVEGKVYWLNAWIKQGKNGKFLSLSVKPKAARAPEVQQKVKGGVADMDEDSLPF
jgi:hypothetical protein